MRGETARGRLLLCHMGAISPKKYLDVWRYLMYKKEMAPQHQGHVLCSKQDFSRFTTLPDYWWYYLDQHCQGKGVDFHIKIKLVLSWSPVHYVEREGKLVKVPRFTVKKLCLTTVKRACDFSNLDQ